jgi:hypothetical protein
MTKLTDAFQLRPWTLEDKGKHFFKENQRINRIEEDDDIQDYKKPWVGLTDQEKILFSTWLDYKSDDEVFTAIETKLREKNA